MAKKHYIWDKVKNDILSKKIGGPNCEVCHPPKMKKIKFEFVSQSDYDKLIMLLQEKIKKIKQLQDELKKTNQKFTDYQKFLQLLEDFRIPYSINNDGDYICKGPLREWVPNGFKTIRINETGLGKSSKVWGSSDHDCVEVMFDKDGKFFQMVIAGGIPPSSKSTYKPKKIVKWKK